MDPRMPTVVAYRSGYLMHSKDDRGKYTKGGGLEAYDRQTKGNMSNKTYWKKKNAVDARSESYQQQYIDSKQSDNVKQRNVERRANLDKFDSTPTSHGNYMVEQARKKRNGPIESSAKQTALVKKDQQPADNWKDEVARRGRNLERDARKNVKTSNVPSQNPTAGGGAMPNYIKGDKDRANHKYIAKVTTKSGKTRYIYSEAELQRLQNKGYDVTTASGQHLSNKAAFDSQAKGKQTELRAKALQRGREQEAAYQRQKARNSDPMYHVQRFAKATMRNIQKTAGNVMNSAKNFLKQFGIG